MITLDKSRIDAIQDDFWNRYLRKDAISKKYNLPLDVVSSIIEGDYNVSQIKVEEKTQKKLLYLYRTCEIEGCNRKYSAKGMCAMHYRIKWKAEREKKIREGRFVEKTRKAICEIEGCNRRHSAKGLCRMHYLIKWKQDKKKKKLEEINGDY